MFPLGGGSERRCGRVDGGDVDYDGTDALNRNPGAISNLDIHRRTGADQTPPANVPSMVTPAGRVSGNRAGGTPRKPETPGRKPVGRTTALWKSPAAIAVTPASPAGTDPWPSAFCPQATTVPSALSARLWSDPAAMATTD